MIFYSIIFICYNCTVLYLFSINWRVLCYEYCMVLLTCHIYTTDLATSCCTFSMACSWEGCIAEGTPTTGQRTGKQVNDRARHLKWLQVYLPPSTSSMNRHSIFSTRFETQSKSRALFKGQTLLFPLCACCEQPCKPRTKITQKIISHCLEEIA